MKPFILMQDSLYFASPTELDVLFIFGGLGVIALFLTFVVCIEGLINWWDRFMGINTYYGNNTTYTAPKVVTPAAKKPATTYVKPRPRADVDGFLPGDRKWAPQAMFFGRTGERSTVFEGPFEEAYLDPFELGCWHNKVKRLKIRESEIRAKSPTLTQSDDFLGQNDSYSGYRG